MANARGKGAAGIFDFFGDGGKLLVTGEEPDADCKSYSEDLEERLVRGSEGARTGCASSASGP